MRQPDHEHEERSFGDIQRAIDFENSMIRAIKRFMSWPLHSKTFLSRSETHRNLS